MSAVVGEIEWEEFLMYTAHEAGQTVPNHLLPVHMVKNQAKILETYAALKEETLNDASGSIWDSKDTMAQKKGKKDKGKGTQAANTSIDASEVQSMCKDLADKLEDQSAMIKQLQEMLVTPERQELKLNSGSTRG